MAFAFKKSDEQQVIPPHSQIDYFKVWEIILPISPANFHPLEIPD